MKFDSHELKCHLPEPVFYQSVTENVNNKKKNDFTKMLEVQ